MIDEKGVIYPWVTGLISLLFIVLFSLVKQYHNQLKITDIYKSYTSQQNLIDTAQIHFMRERENNPETGVDNPFNFFTPDGMVKVNCSEENDRRLKCQWDTTTNKGNGKVFIKYYTYLK